MPWGLAPSPCCRWNWARISSGRSAPACWSTASHTRGRRTSFHVPIRALGSRARRLSPAPSL
eukprot:1883187-Lingulodinium_polyedra.AAC.1